jgi:hypothetical protein
MVFSDDSTITLAENTKLEIKEFLFKDQSRKGIFSLAIGKLTADVKKYIGGDNVFEVYSPTVGIGVRGTGFEFVEALKDGKVDSSAENQRMATVSCTDGSLNLSAFSATGAVVSTAVLEAGQMAVIIGGIITISAIGAAVAAAAITKATETGAAGAAGGAGTGTGGAAAAGGGAATTGLSTAAIAGIAIGGAAVVGGVAAAAGGGGGGGSSGGDVSHNNNIMNALQSSLSGYGISCAWTSATCAACTVTNYPVGSKCPTWGAAACENGMVYYTAPQGWTSNSCSFNINTGAVNTSCVQSAAQSLISHCQ